VRSNKLQSVDRMFPRNDPQWWDRAIGLATAPAIFAIVAFLIIAFLLPFILLQTVAHALGRWRGRL
jgi:hypothetical protein